MLCRNANLTTKQTINLRLGESYNVRSKVYTYCGFAPDRSAGVISYTQDRATNSEYYPVTSILYVYPDNYLSGKKATCPA